MQRLNRGTLDGFETAGAGGIVGELALVDAGPRAGAAVVRSEAVVMSVERACFVSLVQQHPTFALQAMAVMADRLRGVPAAADGPSSLLLTPRVDPYTRDARFGSSWWSFTPPNV